MCFGYNELCCTYAGCGWPSNSPLTPVPDAQGKNVSLDAIEAVLNEIASISPDDFMHLGGDEVNQVCWQNDTAVRAWMLQQGMGNNTDLVYEYFVS